MKKLLLTITMAVGGLGSLAPSAQAHPFYHGGFHYGCGYHYCYHGGHYGYWYWNNGCRFFRVVVVPPPVWVCP